MVNINTSYTLAEAINNTRKEALLSRAQALRVLKSHGIESFTVQTAYSKEEGIAKSGYSFAENVGIKDFYTVKEVKNWLGY